MCIWCVHVYMYAGKTVWVSKLVCVCVWACVASWDWYWVSSVVILHFNTLKQCLLLWQPLSPALMDMGITGIPIPTGQFMWYELHFLHCSVRALNQCAITPAPLEGFTIELSIGMERVGKCLWSLFRANTRSFLGYCIGSKQVLWPRALCFPCSIWRSFKTVW